ncbi:LTA synthase family protein [Flavihumibacter rivuli]|uniref:LTA synthase family protein n=1 Tax=Flavihumibacter rivuli TaxID=2838156 RepID=UPI001BDF2E4C|nr:LTA synthase family protein [Flavihumibacter rivuli]ULQ56417.1 LTA synthase family protein [Flavihumibacter rivuli]
MDKTGSLLERYRIWWLVLLVFVAVSAISRTALLVSGWPEVSLRPLQLLGVYGIGLFYDLIAGWYFALPVFLLVWLLPVRFQRSKFGLVLMKSVLLLSILLLVLNAFAEWFFWQEFNVRYNFIAVDYLIYTNEVLGNIWQSYNIPLVIAGVLLLTFLVWFFVRKRVVAPSGKVGPVTHISVLLMVVTIGLGDFVWVDEGLRNFSDNKLNNELAGNGMFQFGSAFRKNEMSYEDFYPTEDTSKVFTTLHQLLQTPGARFVSNEPQELGRSIEPAGAGRKYNVVLISIESLSAEYLDYFKEYHNRIYPDYLIDELGYAPKLTPNLDSLINESLFFTQLYASGTRTVRGLEALSTALPPTPGQSIVKRLPTRSGLFTLGSVLKQNGYDTKYVYGGNSFFDNMGDYFGKNGYAVIDEDAIPEDSIHHKTVWGVCDEDLYALAEKEMAISYASGKPFFQHIMTVSHHRPYTYPEGKVTVPPKFQRREGALQYTDYAIGKFLQAMRGKPWFNSTIFVIVADHCADSGGRTDMPLNKYHIPCWIYAPGIVKPGKFERLTSQIDLDPTIMGLLNLPYTSRFFGYDVFKLEPGRERLLLVNYQDVAYVKNDKMVVLSPRKQVRMFRPDYRTGAVVPIPKDPKMIEEAIAYFEGASYLFSHNLFTASVPRPQSVTIASK